MTRMRTGICPTLAPKLTSESPLAVGVPGFDVARADLQFKRGGDAVARLDFVVFGILPVGVEVYEARGDDQPGGVNDLIALDAGVGEGFLCDRRSRRRFGRRPGRIRGQSPCRR